ncbi:DNA-binding transcriptional regulator, MerR family [Saccharopolyspora antimicrobica]|uniref:DNA-binding transcriptional MerR regulator n=1 Tax=Saccharopolyspora antimicrobica TaxID=455193 RepID=A0A1I5G6I6_9PSEU|nr:DNA-binding transcriptional MerR regulator [Saccharopolyspora antimicrobica]SFO31556.1 DNA-binding transcriptional regulator, MerR family [Saccharopolyspora antimicrobica]
MDDVNDTARYTIGELARRTGLSVKTIRFYSDIGVVPPTDRTAAGYRQYDVTAISRLELVRTLRELGAGLDEVKRVLARETTLAQLAGTHLGLLEEQMRVLRTRRAVLRAVVKLDRTTEEVRLMQELAKMSDEERNRLIDEFWDEVSSEAGLNVSPEFTEWMRSAKPNLPDDPSTEQLEAWIELAELVQDEDFRATVRGLYREQSDRRDAGEAMVEQDEAPKWWAITDEAKAAVESGVAPDSAEARALADRMIALATEQWKKPDTPEFRREMADHYESHDSRLSRYWELLAIINSWPQHPVTDAVTRWLAAALRASAQ